ASIEIDLDGSATGILGLGLTTVVDDPDACVPSQTDATSPVINYDNVPTASATDSVESDLIVWTVDSTDGPKDLWAREMTAPDNFVWHGTDYGTISDTRLTSPPLDVSPNQPLVITFNHRYQFETGMGQNWDGGVIEVSLDNGASWNDIGK